MLNSMKYSMIRALRDKEFMFSTIIIAVLMGTVMYFMTETMLEELESGTLEIPIAVVEVSGSEHGAFIEILETAGIFDLEFVDMEQALFKLEANDVEGIFEMGDDISLLVTHNGFTPLLLQTIADEYVMTSGALTTIATENPEDLEPAIISLMNQESVILEMEVTNQMVDTMQLSTILFITMTAISGMFVGFERAIMTNDDGKVASRRITSSFGKVNMLIADLVGVALLVVVMTFSIWAYFSLVLGVNLEMNVALAALGFLLTALFSVSFGALFGLVAPGKRKTREQILMGAYMGMMVLAFFGPQVRVDAITLINRVNPMSVLLDSLMALNMGNYVRYFGFTGTIAVATVIFLGLVIIALRRNRHVDAR